MKASDNKSRIWNPYLGGVGLGIVLFSSFLVTGHGLGASGGLGGYFPPLVMGATYDEEAHSYTIGLILLCITAVVTLGYTLFGIKKRQPLT